MADDTPMGSDAGWDEMEDDLDDPELQMALAMSMVEVRRAGRSVWTPQPHKAAAP